MMCFIVKNLIKNVVNVCKICKTSRKRGKKFAKRLKFRVERKKVRFAPPFFNLFLNFAPNRLIYI